jgi:hypothetical protein
LPNGPWCLLPSSKAAVKNHPGQQCYTRMTLIYPGARPNGVGQTQTVSLPASLPAPARA